MMNTLKLSDINTTGTPSGGYEFFDKRAVQEFLSWICYADDVKMVTIDYTVGGNVITVAFTLDKERETNVRYTITFEIDDSKLTAYASQYNVVHGFDVNNTEVSLERLLGKAFISITEIADDLANTITPSDYADFITQIVEPMTFKYDTFGV